MDKGVYLAATSIRADKMRQQNQSHEMANLSTIGFKKAFQVTQVTYRVDTDNSLSSRFYKVADTLGEAGGGVGGVRGAAMVMRVRTGPAGQPRRRRITCHARPDERGWRCVPTATGFGQRWPLQQPAAPAGSTPVSRGHSAWAGGRSGRGRGGSTARGGHESGSYRP